MDPDYYVSIDCPPPINPLDVPVFDRSAFADGAGFGFEFEEGEEEDWDEDDL